MELSLKGSGIAYEPGDVIGLRCPNPPADTAYVLERLQVIAAASRFPARPSSDAEVLPPRMYVNVWTMR